MSLGEIVHRLGMALRVRVEERGLLTASHIPSGDWRVRCPVWLAAGRYRDQRPYEVAAAALLQGQVRVFAKTVPPGATYGWNRDPLTGRTAPLQFGKRIDYRDENRVGNIKYLWEPNRHLELVTLAQAFALTRDDHYLQAVSDWLQSWFDQCPYPKGVNWASSLELAIRLINWSLTWQLVGQADSPLFAGARGVRLRDRWLAAIYQHAHFIHHGYSRHSSANNHLIGEAAGVFIASCTWPFWRQLDRWGTRAHRRLVDAAAAQTHADGVNREQAIAYQQFVLDFFILSALAGRARSIEFPAGYWRCIERMIEFIQSIMDVAGNVPMFGDADDGYVVRLSQEDGFCPFRSLLATGALLFDRPDFAAKSGGLDDKTRMLLGADRWEALWTRAKEHPVQPRQEFPEGGYYVLGTRFECTDEARLVADAGPLGYLSIAAHGHADALAFTLSIGGREILIDPGTYSYHTQPVWRQYFRGTSAHNTVQVDGQDQSVQGGNFMWLRHARTRCLGFRPVDGDGLFAGEHDGYCRLADPVVHQREIRMHGRSIEVTDRLICRAAHQVQRCWHFSERCRIEHFGTSVIAVNGAIRVTLRALEPLRELRRLRGSENPPAGWVSRAFDVKVPADSVYFVNDITGRAELKTLIEWDTGSRGVADEG